ncbi:MarR family winged helix-turn-helix transcriptional regulator [Novosphingobium sp.]|uniref:MarR family winged helix-turn-helix transcriptional regulator n=1 Tax=Novosphingobium sp. TaxID=1874826 RepID=UPI00286E7796|nr:MarR family winged helix-turn-helix transcriptional regulator [Novosphingobium sp.]
MFKWKKSSADPVDLSLLARKLIHYRQMRSEFFADEAISAGGWDLLLHLYAAPGDSAPITVSSAARSLGLSNGIVISALERACHFGFAAQGDSPGNWEHIQVSLTPAGRAAMEGYLGKFADNCQPAAA